MNSNKIDIDFGFTMTIVENDIKHTYIRILFARDNTRASEEQRCACVP